MTEAENILVLNWKIHAAARTAEPMHEVKRKHLLLSALSQNEPQSWRAKKKTNRVKTWPNWAATGFIPNLPISKQT